MENKKIGITVSDKISDDEISKWERKDIVIINAPCGVGKSHFIKNKIYKKSKKENKKILFLIHRKACISQFEMEIKRDKKDDVIDLMTYQSLENKILNNKDYKFDKKYKYIVSDEFHYFLDDSTFSENTDLSFQKILNANQIKIFMSATASYLTNIIKNITKNKKKLYSYNIRIKNNNIEKMMIFEKEAYINNLIEKTIKENSKTIIFFKSAEKAYKFYKKYKNKSIFNCSEYNKKFKRFISKKHLSIALKNEVFESNVLITTTAMDAGVNFKDKSIKDIVLYDVEDLSTIIQCIGRKRKVNKKDKAILHIKNISNKKIFKTICEKKEKLEKINYLKKYGDIGYLKIYDRLKNDIVYPTLNKEDEVILSFNPMVVFKIKKDIIDLEKSLTYDKYGFCKILSKKIGVDKVLVAGTKNMCNVAYVESVLKDNLDKFFYTKEDKDKFAFLLNLKDSKNRVVKSYTKINSLLENMDSDFVIRYKNKTNKNIKYKKVWYVTLQKNKTYQNK